MHERCRWPGQPRFSDSRFESGRSIEIEKHATRTGNGCERQRQFAQRPLVDNGREPVCLFPVADDRGHHGARFHQIDRRIRE